MSNGITIRWHDQTTAEIVNGTGQELRRVRAQVVGDTRIAGRRTWTADVQLWQPGQTIRLVRVEPRGPQPHLRMRFQIGNPGGTRAPWYTDTLPLQPPAPTETDPWSLGARTRRR